MFRFKNRWSLTEIMFYWLLLGCVDRIGECHEYLVPSTFIFLDRLVYFLNLGRLQSVPFLIFQPIHKLFVLTD